MALRPFITIVLLLAAMVGYAQQPPRKPEPWDTCIYVEGKGDYCRAAEKARKFEDYLSIGWTLDPVDGFTIESGFNRLKATEHKINPVWREVGQLGASRIRTVKYLIDDATDGVSVILALRGDGLWIPLMKIAGGLPAPTVLHDGIIGMSRNFGGNVPMFRTWAWVWNGQGPILLDPYTAVDDATQKIGGGYGCYAMEIEWDTLHTRTYCARGEDLQKGNFQRGSFHYQLDVLFDLKDAQLVTKQVDLVDFAQEGPREEPKHWPR